MSCGNVGFLTLLGVRCEGDGNEDFLKALAEIQLDKSHWIEMLAQGELGRNNAGRRFTKVLLVKLSKPNCSLKLSCFDPDCQEGTLN